MPTLLHFHDPMCSWCWAFKPAWQSIVDGLPASVQVKRVLGGLAPDSDDPMPNEMREAIAGYWKQIEVAVPGTKFNHDFWTLCTPRRSTYPACRAVAAARLLDASLEESMNSRIQSAYYLEAKNPSNAETLIDLAVELGFDRALFSETFLGDEAHTAFGEDQNLCAQFGVMGFPSLVLYSGSTATRIGIDYNDPTVSLRQLSALLEVAS